MAYYQLTLPFDYSSPTDKNLIHNEAKLFLLNTGDGCGVTQTKKIKTVYETNEEGVHTGMKVLFPPRKRAIHNLSYFEPFYFYGPLYNDFIQDGIRKIYTITEESETNKKEEIHV